MWAQSTILRYLINLPGLRVLRTHRLFRGYELIGFAERVNRVELTQDEEVAALEEMVARPTVLGFSNEMLLECDPLDREVGRVSFALHTPGSDRLYALEAQMQSVTSQQVARVLYGYYALLASNPEATVIPCLVAPHYPSTQRRGLVALSRHLPLICLQVTAVEVKGQRALVAERIVDSTQATADGEIGVW